MGQVEGQRRVAAGQHRRGLAADHQRQREGLGDVLQAVRLLGPLGPPALLHTRRARRRHQPLLGRVGPGHGLAAHGVLLLGCLDTATVAPREWKGGWGRRCGAGRRPFKV